MILQKLNATSELAHANDTNVLSVDKCIPVQSCQQQKMESVVKKNKLSESQSMLTEPGTKFPLPCSSAGD